MARPKNGQMYSTVVLQAIVIDMRNRALSSASHAVVSTSAVNSPSDYDDNLASSGTCGQGLNLMSIKVLGQDLLLA